MLKQVAQFQEFFSGILLVDNRSLDSGPAAAIDAIERYQLKNVKILQNKENYNLGGSHKVAFQYATENEFDFVLVLHGDNQADLSDIISLIKTHQHQKYECLLGARFHPLSHLIGYSKFRTLGNIVVNGFCSIACGQSILDMGSGLNLYARSFFQDKRIINFPNDLSFNVYLLFHTCFNANSFLFFPLSWKEEDQISNAKIFKQLKKIMALIFKTTKDKNLIYSEVNSIQKYDYDVYFEN